MPITIDTPVQFLKGVGPRRAEAFRRMGVETIEDLLYHVPHRYLDATSVTPIGHAKVDQEVTLVGRVVSKAVVPTRKRLRVFRAVLEDSSGVIECAWPGQAFLDRVIKQGQLLLVSGPVKHYHGRQVTPREQVVLAEAGDEDSDEDMRLGMVLPVYPATEGLSHRMIRKIVASHLDQLIPFVVDTLPREVRSASKLRDLRESFVAIHRPTSRSDVETGRRRRAFDELFDLPLVLARARFLAKTAVTGTQF